jgi:hypothetical protein
VKRLTRIAASDYDSEFVVVMSELMIKMIILLSSTLMIMAHQMLPMTMMLTVMMTPPTDSLSTIRDVEIECKTLEILTAQSKQINSL